MDIKRYVQIQAVKTKDNELIPIWDERLSFEKTEMYGNVISIKDDYRTYHNTVDCVYDMKKKRVLPGIEIDYYPEKVEYKIGEDVMFETKSLRTLSKSRIKDIVYENYELEIVKGKKMQTYYKNNIKDVEIDDNTIYAIKIWKPMYILECGNKTEYTHQLYHIDE